MQARLETKEEAAARRAKPKTCQVLVLLAEQRGGERYSGDYRFCGQPAAFEFPLGVYNCRACFAVVGP